MPATAIRPEDRLSLRVTRADKARGPEYEIDLAPEIGEDGLPTGKHVESARRVIPGELPAGHTWGEKAGCED